MTLANVVPSAALAVFLLSAVHAGSPAAAETPPVPHIAPATVAAGEHREAILHIPRPGRYALTVTSDQGASLQLVDRMAGPGDPAGRAGERDGRLDVLLDRGEYKLVARGAAGATGELGLAVREFGEINDAGRRLAELELLTTELGDFEQRSWWLRLEERRRVIFEAAGRHLADLRLWRDGSWLVDAAPLIDVVEPANGQPLGRCRLSADLGPGLYRLIAYGGAGQPWAEDVDPAVTSPLHLRWGLPRLAEAGRQRRVVSPFGSDRFLIPDGATYFRAEVPEARPLELRVASWDAGRPFAGGGDTAAIDKESLPPVAEVRLGSGRRDRVLEASVPTREWRVVTVTAPAGQPYVLQHFRAAQSFSFRGTCCYWLSTVHSGHAADSVEPTAILTRGGSRTPVAYDVIEIGAEKGWARRANLLGPLSLHLRVADPAVYRVSTGGVAARHRLEPFFADPPPREYEPPPWVTGPGDWELDEGFWVLHVEPVEQGIVELEVGATGRLEGALGAAGLGSSNAPRPAAGIALLGAIEPLARHVYTLHLNRRPEVVDGVILRRLPLDLERSLPLSQAPGERMAVPFEAATDGVLVAETSAGERLEVALDLAASGDAWSREAYVTRGRHLARVRVGGDETVSYSLAFEPAAAAEAPEVVGERPAESEFPVLTAAEPQFLDLDRSASATYLVRADEPALYRLESSGLLATEGNLRTRVVPSLVRREANGVGRNFLLQQVLRPGDYQLTVAALGRSAGHLGIRLARAPLADGGSLALGVPARRRLEAGEAVAYRFRVDQQGRYRLRALGLGQVFDARLEDGEGWPVVPPGFEADRVLELRPGDHRLIVLPRAVEARLVTLVEPILEPPQRTGHGPHDLELGRHVEHLWTEPPAAGAGAVAERPPDVWRFELPAAVDLDIEVDAEMGGELWRDGEKVATLAPGRGWNGATAAGMHELRLAASRIDNRRAYRLRVVPQQLVAGLSRPLTAPAEVAVAVGKDALVELASFGGADVRATLLDASGTELARVDDRPGDWNFVLARRLAAGRYRLVVEPVGTTSAEVEVAMRQPPERVGEALVLPATARLEPGNAVVLHPLTLPSDGEQISLAARSAESFGLALEAAGADGWKILASTTGREARLAVPLPPGPARGSYRLRVWSQDLRGNPVTARIVSAPVARMSEAELAGGGRWALPEAGEPPTLVAVDAGRPGCFELPEGVGFSPRAGRAARPMQVAASTGAVFWLSVEADAPGRPRVVRRFFDPARGDRLRLALAPGEVARCDVVGGEGVSAVRATGAGVRPLIALGDEAPHRGTSPGLSSSVSAADGDVGSVAVWGDGVVELSGRRAALVLRGAAPWGRLGEALDGAAQRWTLPAGAKRLRLMLTPDVVALLAGNDGERDARAVLWADPAAGNLDVALTSNARDVTFLTLGESGRFAFEVTPAEDAAAPTGFPLERALFRRGSWRIELPPDATTEADGILRVRGVESAILVGADGSVADGRDLRLPSAGGTLWLEHGPGHVFAWRGDDPWGAVAPPPGVVVTPPATLTFAGEAAAYAIDLAAPRILHARGTAPLVSHLAIPGGGRPEVEVHAGGVRLDAYLPAGRSRLTLRPLGGAAEGGVVELSTSEVVEIGEGLGPEILLGAGETRVFAFDVGRAGDVGVGVRAEADLVDTVLSTAGGRRLGRGVVQLHRLEPGRYLLAVEAPAGAPPLRVRPAVVGVEPPSSDPPAEVLERYLALAGPPPGASDAETSDLEANHRGEGQRVGVDLVELAESVGAVVEVEVQADAREQTEDETETGGVERIGHVVAVGEAIRDHHAGADAEVEVAADDDVAQWRHRGVGRAAEAVAVVLDVDLEAEDALRVVGVRAEIGEPVVLDSREPIVLDVVDGAEEESAEADVVVGGSRWRGDGGETTEDQDDA